MLKKLLNGEFSLAETFWKFGVCGLFALNLFTKILGAVLVHKMKGLSFFQYYMKFFNFLRYDTWTLALSLCYLGLLGFLISYCYMFTAGIWRSSAEYNKSIWLRYISRILAVLLVFITLKINIAF